MIKEEENIWVLDNLSISFRKGFSFENSVDRYEGYIKFRNGQKESFEFKLTEDMSANYINIIKEDIVKSAQSLSNRLIDSLGLNK
jgi:hypothetical protein